MDIRKIIALRQKLHANPALSNSEHETAAIIKNFIAQHNPTEIVEEIGGAGIAAIYAFPQKGKNITIRCELDALPIQEDNPISYNPGIVPHARGSSHPNQQMEIPLFGKCLLGF